MRRSPRSTNKTRPHKGRRSRTRPGAVSETAVLVAPESAPLADNGVRQGCGPRNGYTLAGDLALAGRYDEAVPLLEEVAAADDERLSALAANDLGVVAAVAGDLSAAEESFRAALAIDPDCEAARHNLTRLASVGPDSDLGSTQATTATRVAILSFLFNWPSTGGGIVHTVELAQFLQRTGYDVRVIHPQYAPWGIGRVEADCPIATTPLAFGESEWNIAAIQRRFREAVDEFDPDHVLITDCWNFKPHLAEAVAEYPYLLRMQALECVCPLNNLRLLPADGCFTQCGGNQLSDPAACGACLERNARCSGSLHRAERALSEVGTPAYTDKLRRALQGASGVLVLNQAAAKLYEGTPSNVRVVTWGMDGARFPWPWPEEPQLAECAGLKTVLFAGLTEEPIKGFDVLRAACALLWEQRQDFRLVVTADPPEEPVPFACYVGWQSQADLPRYYRATDLTVVPTKAQEGLSRTAVEAMACGRPVIGSRLGGVPDSIVDGETGFLVPPDDPAALAELIAQLLDDAELRVRLGHAGRRRFEERYTWERVIERDYRPLLTPRHRARRAMQAGVCQSLNGRRCLEIGPGESPLPGFDTLDMCEGFTHRAEWGRDRISDVIAEETYDEVYASHVLEHVPWNRTLDALRDVWRILKPGGLLEVWVPDFEYIAGCYAQRRCGDDWRRDNAAGDPMLWANGRIFTYGPGPDNIHRACFDYEHLSNCLSQAGFVEIERLIQRTRGSSHGPIDLGVVGRRPEQDERAQDETEVPSESRNGRSHTVMAGGTP